MSPRIYDIMVPNSDLLCLQYSTTDTVISVEDDPEIEALTEQPQATPTNHTQPAVVRHQQSSDHMRIDLEQGHDIPGLVAPTEPQVLIYGLSCFIVGQTILIAGHPSLDWIQGQWREDKWRRR